MTASEPASPYGPASTSDGGIDDPDAWMRGVVKRFELPLIQYGQRITGCRERARDAAQDTFVRLQRLGPSGLGGDDPAKWLFTVCRNRCLDICRKEHRMTYLDQEASESEPSHELGPAEQLVRKEAAGFLLKILGKLPPRQQEVIQLKFQNGLSYQQISEITQLSVSNVGFLIHRGIKALREQHAALASQYVDSSSPRTTTPFIVKPATP